MNQWYYSQGDQQQGPVDDAQIKAMIQSGQLQPTTLVWKEGMADWATISTVAELAVAPQPAAAQPAGNTTGGFSLGQSPLAQKAAAKTGGMQTATTNPYASPGVTTGYNSGGIATKMTIGQLLFGFNGRIRRGQFWLGMLLSLGIGFAFIMVMGILGGVVGAASSAGGGEPSEGGLFAVLGIVAIGYLALIVVNTWISFALYIKRYHDRDKSGWWVLVSFIPFIGVLWVLIECGCLEGSAGPNRYGDPQP